MKNRELQKHVTSKILKITRFSKKTCQHEFQQNETHATAMASNQAKALEIEFCRRRPRMSMSTEHAMRQGCEQILAIMLRCGCKERGTRVGCEQIWWRSCDASCCRSGLSLCRKATLPGTGKGDCGLDMPLFQNNRVVHARLCTMFYHAQLVDGTSYLEGPKNQDGLNVGISVFVSYMCTQYSCVYIYAERQDEFLN